MLGGGVLFAVFPLAYASLFSGLYLPFMLVLLVMILRTVALEFRSKEDSPRWRSTWDVVFGGASLGLAFLLGIAFGDVVSGVPLDQNGNISTGLSGLLTPFALLVGVTTVVMFSMQGGIFLLLKTEGELHDRIARLLPRDHGRLLRAQYARGDRDARVPPADHRALPDRPRTCWSSRPRRCSRWSARG